MGLSNLILGTNTFEELLELSCKGDNQCVDMTAKDIFGDPNGLYGLNPDIVCSSFGKCGVSQNTKYRFQKEN